MQKSGVNRIKEGYWATPKNFFIVMLKLGQVTASPAPTSLHAAPGDLDAQEKDLFVH
jgi:hypothetical protein